MSQLKRETIRVPQTETCITGTCLSASCDGHELFLVAENAEALRCVAAKLLPDLQFDAAKTGNVSIVIART